MMGLYSLIKAVIIATPGCPDGSSQLACPSCLADSITKALHSMQQTIAYVEDRYGK